MEPLTRTDIQKYNTLREIMDKNSIYRDRILNQRARQLLEAGYEKFVVVNPGQFITPGSLPQYLTQDGKVIDSSFTASATKVGQELGIKTFYTARDLDEAVLICSWQKWFSAQYHDEATDSAVVDWLGERLVDSPHYVRHYQLYGIVNDLYTIVKSQQAHFFDRAPDEVSLSSVVPVTQMVGDCEYQCSNIFHQIRTAENVYRELVNMELAKKDPATRSTWAIAKLKG